MEKSPDAFRTISEVADELDVPQHVLRFWETKFPQIRPLKRGGGRRYYRPDDVELLRGIRHLLYGEGYTIRGVQRILKQDGPRHVQALLREAEDAADAAAEAEARAKANRSTTANREPSARSSERGATRPAAPPEAGAESRGGLGGLFRLLPGRKGGEGEADEEGEPEAERAFEEEAPAGRRLSARRGEAEDELPELPLLSRREGRSPEGERIEPRLDRPRGEATRHPDPSRLDAPHLDPPRGEAIRAPAPLRETERQEPSLRETPSPRDPLPPRDLPSPRDLPVLREPHLRGAPDVGPRPFAPSRQPPPQEGERRDTLFRAEQPFVPPAPVYVPRPPSRGPMAHGPAVPLPPAPEAFETPDFAPRGYEAGDSGEAAFGDRPFQPDEDAPYGNTSYEEARGYPAQPFERAADFDDGSDDDGPAYPPAGPELSHREAGARAGRPVRRLPLDDAGLSPEVEGQLRAVLSELDACLQLLDEARRRD